MRFLHVNHRYAPFVGGSERYIQEVSEHFVASGHQVDVITSNAFDLEYFWDARRLRTNAPAFEHLNGVGVQRVPVKHLPLSALLFQGGRRTLGELSRIPGMPSLPGTFASRILPWIPDLTPRMQTVGPADLVHATNLGLEGVGIAAMRVASQWDVPFVFTPFLHLGRAGDAVARRYVSMPHQRRLLSQATHVISMTYLEASFLKQIGIDASRITVSGVGVALPEVSGGVGQRFREKLGTKGSLIGVASAVAFDKGSRELVLGVGKLRAAGHDIELVLAGPRLQEFDNWFERQEERIKAGVHLPGFISAHEKRDMLAAIDVLAMPSRTESFGIAFLEGWANRKPVIAANAGAVPEIVRHGENGLLVEFGDVEALASAILTLLADDELAQRMGGAGYEMTVNHFTWPAVLRRATVAYSLALGIDLERE